MARPAVLAALCLAALSHCALAAGQSPRGDRFMNSGQGSQRATDKCTFVYKARPRGEAATVGAAQHKAACGARHVPWHTSATRQGATRRLLLVAPAPGSQAGAAVARPPRGAPLSSVLGWHPEPGCPPRGRRAAPSRVLAAATSRLAPRAYLGGPPDARGPPHLWSTGEEAGLHVQAGRQSERLQPGAGQPDWVLQAERAGRAVHHLHVVVAGVSHRSSQWDTRPHTPLCTAPRVADRHSGLPPTPSSAAT